MLTRKLVEAGVVGLIAAAIGTPAVATGDPGDGTGRPDDPGKSEQAPPGQAKKTEEAPAATPPAHAQNERSAGKPAANRGKAKGKAKARSQPAQAKAKPKPAKAKPAKPKPANQGSDNANAGKVTICHATGSATNPFVKITISRNALKAHQRHQDGRDIVPAPASGCPGGAAGNGPDGDKPKEGKVTICHATGSATNPFVVITISENAIPAHQAHQDGQDIIPAPAGGCPPAPVTPAGPTTPVTPTTTTTAVTPTAVTPAAAPAQGQGVLGEVVQGGQQPSVPRLVADVGDEAGAAPAAAGGVAGESAEGDARSLPFTGLTLALLAALGMALLVGGAAARHAAHHPRSQH